jgi:flagellar operon protein
MAAPIPLTSGFSAALGQAASIGPAAAAAKATAPASAGASFASELAKAAGAHHLKFSAHAQRRLASPDIAMDDGRLGKLAQAVDQAAAKGARDSLMLMDDVGLIVNVPSRTVVTAMTAGGMEQGVITNIDSTVIIRS